MTPLTGNLQHGRNLSNATVVHRDNNECSSPCSRKFYFKDFFRALQSRFVNVQCFQLPKDR